MMIIIILIASYIGDDVRIVYSLANTMRSFSVTEGRTNKGILGVGRLEAEGKLKYGLLSLATHMARAVVLRTFSFSTL